jgi:glycopeptide antibiotics resistance protein
MIFSQLLFFIFSPVWLELTWYLHNVVLIALWGCFTVFVIFIYCFITKQKIYISQVTLQLIFIGYTVSLIMLLFMRKSYGVSISNFVPFRTISIYLFHHNDFLISFYNIAANIILFIPFGLYYCFVRKRRSPFPLFLYAIFTISSVEGMQYISHRGSMDIDDLLLNVSGVMIGYFLFPVVRKVLGVR